MTDPLAFYKQVCELAVGPFPGRKVGFSVGIAAYPDQWFPAIVENGALVIRLPDGRTIPVQNARDWRFRIKGEPRSEVLTFPNYPECRNFSPKAVVADLVRHTAHTGNLSAG